MAAATRGRGATADTPSRAKVVAADVAPAAPCAPAGPRPPVPVRVRRRAVALTGVKGRPGVHVVPLPACLRPTLAVRKVRVVPEHAVATQGTVPAPPPRLDAALPGTHRPAAAGHGAGAPPPIVPVPAGPPAAPRARARAVAAVTPRHAASGVPLGAALQVPAARRAVGDVPPRAGAEVPAALAQGTSAPALEVVGAPTARAGVALLPLPARVIVH